MSSPSKFVGCEDGYSHGGESDTPLKELKRLINTLTHTGEKSLDSSVLKSITKICKQSNSYIVHAYHLLMEQLEANHSEIRYSAFQICIELFRRSHCFRELLVSNLQHVMILTAETDPLRCMPPPKSTANMLKKLTLVTVRDWANNYGSGYKKLHHGISYLRNCKKVDFNAMAMEENAERSRQEELKRRKLALQNERFRKMAEEIKEVQPDVINSLTELENCISLVLPRPEDLFVQDECTSAPETEQRRGHDKQHASISSDDSSSERDSDHEQQIEPVFDFRKYGIVNPLFRITLNLNADGAPLIEKTEENAAILSTAQELYRLICNKYQPCIIKWETVLEKCSELEASVTSDVSKKVSDLKKRVEASLDKYRRLNLHSASDTHMKEDDDDTSDSDFEEVQNKEGYEAFSKSTPVESQIEGKDPDSSSATPSKLASSKPGWSLISDENNEKDPTSVLSTLSSTSSSKKHPSPPALEKKSASAASASSSGSSSGSSSRQRGVQDSQPGPSRLQKRKDKLLAVAPKVPFDVDLYHWEDEKIEAPTLFTLKPDGHRFWVSTAEDRDEMRDPDGEANLRTRVIEFSGTFRPVEWTCRAPLASGKLCPRQDREKCPFHGKIIGRDKTGKPSSGEDQQAEEERQHLEKLNQVPDWQDPKLLKELKEKTGLDLRMPDKTKRGWRKHIPGQEPEKKYVGLTDIKAMHNTTYSRLSKKVFQKSAMKRVASAMDKLDRKRFRDKYGDQFNYVFDHS